MNVIAHLLPAIATVEDAQRIFTENPLVAAHFERLGLDRANKARSRVPLAKVYSEEVVAFLLPKKAAGRPAYVGSFNLMTAPARTLVTEALGQPLEDVTWTAETASRAADALVVRYLNPGSACAALGHLRLGIGQVLGLDAAAMALSPIIAAAKREDVTKAKHELGAERLAKRIDEGIELPAVYATIASLTDRARAFVAAPAATPQSAADLLVIFSARPGEAETLKIGERGAVTGKLTMTGMLKKKADDTNIYNLLSAIGEQPAVQYLEAWRGLPSGDRRMAMTGLTRLTANWGLQRRDLRAIGAALALRHELLEGNVANAAQGRVLHAEALRHAPAKKAAAQVHYERVADPMVKVAADLAELGADDLAEIMALIAAKRLAR